MKSLEWHRINHQDPHAPIPEENEKILVRFDGGHIEDAIARYEDVEPPAQWYYVLFDGETLISEATHWAYYNDPE